MSTTTLTHPAADRQAPPDQGGLTRVSARFGLAFAICQLTVMVGMTALVLPHGGSPSDPPLLRGHHVLAAQELYRVGNLAFMVAGMLLLGFLGAVHTRLREVDSSGVLATVALASGTLLAAIWPMGAMLHDVALEAAAAGSDVRILSGWDSVAPYTLAFSALPRLFFVGAIVLGLRRAGSSPWLCRIGIVLLPVTLVGTATTITGAMFPVLVLSTLGYELWAGALAWHWMRGPRASR